VVLRWESLKTLSKLMNDVFGACAFGYILGSLPYFVYTFVDFVQPVEIFTFLRRLMMFTSYFGFLITAAIANKNVR